jgi:hypothetical protein
VGLEEVSFGWRGVAWGSKVYAWEVLGWVKFTKKTNVYLNKNKNNNNNNNNNNNKAKQSKN